MPMTNFQSITESPEKLAEFLYDIGLQCRVCPALEACDGACDGVLLEWLQEECDA